MGEAALTACLEESHGEQKQLQERLSQNLNLMQQPLLDYMKREDHHADYEEESHKMADQYG